MTIQIDRREAQKIIEGIFKGILRRPADSESLRHFTDKLLDGAPVSQIIDIFINCEEFKQQTAVKLFAPPGHFYSPIVSPEEAERHLTQLRSRGAPSIPDIHIDHSAMLTLWGQMLPFMQEFPFPDKITAPFHYACENQNFGFGDAVILFALLRLKSPKRIVEIGSGWSSACTLDTAQRYLNGNCLLTFIEPNSALLRDLIGENTSKVRILEVPVQSAPPDVFDNLQAGDILFVDSTHVMRTGSDVCFEIFEIFPKLKKGVLVHIHDMFWPFEYPELWVINENRSWNELYAIRAMLMSNSNWKIIYFNDYFVQSERHLVERDCPRILQNAGGGLWLERQ